MAGRELSCFTQTLRSLLMFINLILVLASLAGIIVGSIEAANKDTNLLKFCAQCKGFNTFMIAAFAVLFVFSMLGFCALWHRNTCMLMLYAAFLVVFFLAALACTIVFILVKNGQFDSELFDSWKTQVRDDPGTICSFQTDLDCNGWDFLCPTSNNSFAFLLPNVSAACPSTCSAEQFSKIMNFTDTCHTKIKSDLNKYYGPLLGIGFGLTFTALIGIVVSCKVRISYDNYAPLEERF